MSRNTKKYEAIFYPRPIAIIGAKVEDNTTYVEMARHGRIVFSTPVRAAKVYANLLKYSRYRESL